MYYLEGVKDFVHRAYRSGYRHPSFKYGCILRCTPIVSYDSAWSIVSKFFPCQVTQSGIDVSWGNDHRIFVNLPGGILTDSVACIIKIILLFMDPDQRNRKPYSQRKREPTLKKVCKFAGLRVRNRHALRLARNMILLMVKRCPACVQRQPGHSSIRTTAGICRHAVPEEARG